MPRYYLKQLSIEGFRGINNHGDPLVLKFKPECVNSIHAPNGVGKSSIFEALQYAIFGHLPRLRELQEAEQGDTYIANRFHPSSTSTIEIVLQSDDGSADVGICITRDAAGVRSVTSPTGEPDPEALLKSLQEDFDKFYEWVLINQDARVINWEKIYGTEFNVQIINLVQYMKKLLGCLLIKYNHILLEEFSPLCEDISNFSISICITYPFRSLKNYKKSMAVGTIGFNDPKIIYSRTTNIIKKAVWDYHIGSFQITLWYNLKHNPKFGKIVKIDQSIHQIHENSFDLIWINKIFDEWLDINCI